MKIEAKPKDKARREKLQKVADGKDLLVQQPPIFITLEEHMLMVQDGERRGGRRRIPLLLLDVHHQH